jgi:hypothetical protein
MGVYRIVIASSATVIVTQRELVRGRGQAYDARIVAPPSKAGREANSLVNCL